MRILITGGAGYIGSHVIQAFLAQGYRELIVVDNLSTGDRRNVIDATLITADIRDPIAMEHLFQTQNIHAICHLAAATVIQESLKNPLHYYDNNVTGTLQLLKAACAHGVSHFIYSSTAAIYAPCTLPVKESAMIAPTHPYGHSKWMGEQIVHDVARAYPINTALLRYFNVAGASPCGRIGQRGPATHLIKNAVRTALQLQPSLPIYGTDYPTPDGTCIRDFIHVSDLAMAHVQTLEYLEKNNGSVTLNCGYGKGYSVLEVINALEKVIDRPLPTVQLDRRPGDLPIVIADNTALQSTLPWKPQYPDLYTLVKSAYDFEQLSNKYA